MLKTCKRFLGIYNDDFNDDITTLIQAAVLDLRRVAIDIPLYSKGEDESYPAYEADIQLAIRLYVQSLFDKENIALLDVYELQKDYIRKCTQEKSP